MKTKTKKVTALRQISRVSTNVLIRDAETIRIEMFALFGGFHYRTIAKNAIGRGDANYEPSENDIRHVAKVLQRAGIRVRDWRNGQSKLSQQVIRKLSQTPVSTGQVMLPRPIKLLNNS